MTRRLIPVKRSMQQTDDTTPEMDGPTCIYCGYVLEELKAHK
jgi:hypothetical protein